MVDARGRDAGCAHHPKSPSFRHIYQDQYREVSSNNTSRAFRIITPVVLIVVAIFARHSAVISIVLGALALLLIAGAVICSRSPSSSAASGSAPPDSTDTGVVTGSIRYGPPRRTPYGVPLVVL